MKANELMIGDWAKVPDKNTPYRRIWAIEYPYNNSVYVDDYGAEDSDENYPIAEIDPIPLTAEILEKNGWWQDEIDGTYHNTMSVYGRKAPFSILDGVAINYVHELQHALRLCGLAELADNFKI